MNILEASIMIFVEVASVMLLLWGVMGYDIEKSKKRTAYVLLAAIATEILVVIIMKTTLGIHPMFRWFALSFIPIAVFGVRKTFLITLTAMVVSRGSDILYGISLMMEGGCMMATHRTVTLDILKELKELRRIGYIIVFIVIFIIMKTYGSKRKEINKAVESKGQIFYLFMGVVLYIIMRGFGSYVKNDAWLHIIQGSSEVFNACICILIFVIVILCMYLKCQKDELKKINALNKKCIEEQTQQYIFLNNTQQELRKFRHDSVSHLSAIQHLAQSSNPQKIYEYTSNLLNKQGAIKYIDTGNIIGDSVINQYYALCKESGIEMIYLGRFASGVDIEETDMCIILTNVIANAYEAAIKCSGKKLLKIELTDFKDRQFIRVMNSVEEQVSIENERINAESSKTDKDAHGFGLVNTVEAVERCNGTIRWENVEIEQINCIMTEIMLELKK